MANVRGWRAVLLAWLVGCASAQGAGPTAQTIVVIAHPAFAQETVSEAELASIFRRNERIDSQGRALVPVNLASDDPLREAFSRALFAQAPADMEAYWNERYFHGIAPPHTVASIEAMLRFVAATPGAIGYVPECAFDGRVKALARLRTTQTLPCPASP